MDTITARDPAVPSGIRRLCSDCKEKSQIDLIQLNFQFDGEQSDLVPANSGIEIGIRTIPGASHGLSIRNTSEYRRCP